VERHQAPGEKTTFCAQYSTIFLSFRNDYDGQLEELHRLMSLSQVHHEIIMEKLKCLMVAASEYEHAVREGLKHVQEMAVSTPYTVNCSTDILLLPITATYL
jgi:hypothetical protein